MLEKRILLVFTVVLINISKTNSVESRSCMKLYDGASSFVCVCNATYCDTVEPETELPITHYTVYSSTRDGLRLQKSVHEFGHIIKAPATKIFLNTSSIRQEIIGFGGTFTDAAGMNIASLSLGAQRNLIDTYFSPSGIEYNLGRIPIASNDMSIDVYSYDFTEGDEYLAKFTIDMTDRTYKIPFIDKAVVTSRRNISLFGSPWSSPGWMKTNGAMVGYSRVAPEWSKVYANYLARFMSEYEGFMLNGRMWGLTTQSGPVRSCNPNSVPQYQSMCWLANQTRDWVVDDHRQSLKDNGYGHIKIFVMDDNRDQLHEWGDAFSDNKAREAIDGFAVQWYHDATTDPDTLTKHYEIFKDKFILASEACIRESKSVILGSWERAEEIGRSIFQDMNNYVSSFTDYNLALNISGGPSWINNNADSPIIVDKHKDQFYKQPMFYMIGHFSKFVPQGSRAIEFEVQSTNEIQVAAFLRPDNSIAVIVANMADHDELVEISDGSHMININITQHSVHTLTWRRDELTRY